nr:acyltransferase domain-containing protein [Streptomyces sp. SID12501]
MEARDGTVEQYEGHLWLGFFATSLVLADVLAEAGTPRDILVGHSGGEVSALVVAGAMTVHDAAQVLCLRTKAVDSSGLPGSGMVALEAPVDRVRALCAAADDQTLTIAVDNGPRQVVISGLDEGLVRIEDAAVALGIKSTRLGIPSAYHNPILGGTQDHGAPLPFVIVSSSARGAKNGRY